MTIKTRFTERFGLKHPIVNAPMDPEAGGVLASAVSEAGGLGLLGGGYVNRSRFEMESSKVSRPDIGCGFITWTIPDDPGLLDLALERFPRAMWLSFSDPGPHAARIKKAGVPLICQVHTLEHAFRAVDVGADVVVAQGTEAGGHGWSVQSTLPFVPAVVDALAKRAPDVLVLAAGGIADGRGLAAALMLGADGVGMGTRFYATQEAVIPEAGKKKAVEIIGEQTIRTSVYDIINNRNWPPGYTGRVVRNTYVEEWHGHEAELRNVREAELARVQRAVAAGDYDVANGTIGESAGLVHDIPKARDVIERTIAEATVALRKFAPLALSGAA
jgi:nitronate monooxygenase